MGTLEEDLANLHRATRRPRNQRRKMRSFRIEEISVVDRPAQEGALATLMKRHRKYNENHDRDDGRFTSGPRGSGVGDSGSGVAEYDRDTEPGRWFADHRRQFESKWGLNAKSPKDKLEEALGEEAAEGGDRTQDFVDLLARHYGVKVPSRKSVRLKRRNQMSAYDPEYMKARARERELEGIEEETGLDEFDMADDDDDPDALDEDEAATRLRALFAQAKGEDQDLDYEEPLDDDEDDNEANAALEDEVDQVKAVDLDADEDEEFDDSTELGALANRFRRRDYRIGKQRALLMATARLARNAGDRVYAKRYLASDPAPFGYEKEVAKRLLAKVASNISTDTSRPYHQAGQAGRVAEMDRRARNHRAKVNRMVENIRAGNQKMRRTDALRQLRDARPSLFR